MENLIAYLRRFYPISHELESWLQQVMKYKKIPKHRVLLKQAILATRHGTLKKDW